ncbi:biotin--[acetyl-CoA-carboxylase] ligase [bacterium]|nr:biotin--[acetyl-CoA-carboxylase] ligase [bacterium]
MSGSGRRLTAREAAWSARLSGGLGRPLAVYAELDSAMDAAHALAEAGAPAGACVVAEHQRAGRGRQTRVWSDRPGDSLLLALLLRPVWPPARGGLLALGAGLALARAADRFGAPLLLKWPNDLLFGERKVAGILSEARLSAGGYRHLVLGLGINVHQGPADFPPELRGAAASLDEAAGRRLERGELLAALLAELETVLAVVAGADPGADARLVEAWRRRWPHRGAAAWDARGRRLCLLDVEADGALRVSGPAGEERLEAGELSLRLGPPAGDRA